MTTFGFIGAGNMAGAIVRGAVEAGFTSGDDAATFLLTSAHESASRLAEELDDEHVDAVSDAADLVSRSDVVVLGIKPYVIPEIADELAKPLAEAEPLVISLAAGVTLERLESLLPDGARVVRVMPNMAAAVGESMTALAAGTEASEEDLATARELMDSVGRTAVIAEKDFSAFIGLAGSSPAFVFAFIDALSRAGVLGGIPKAQAVEMVAQAVVGSALTVQVEAAKRADGKSGKTPADLVDAVCSPGGTTVAGVVAMERAGFSTAVIDAFNATVARDRELGA